MIKNKNCYNWCRDPPIFPIIQVSILSDGTYFLTFVYTRAIPYFAYLSLFVVVTQLFHWIHQFPKPQYSRSGCGQNRLVDGFHFVVFKLILILCWSVTLKHCSLLTHSGLDMYCIGLYLLLYILFLTCNNLSRDYSCLFPLLSYAYDDF